MSMTERSADTIRTTSELRHVARHDHAHAIVCITIIIIIIIITL